MVPRFTQSVKSICGKKILIQCIYSTEPIFFQKCIKIILDNGKAQTAKEVLGVES